MRNTLTGAVLTGAVLALAACNTATTSGTATTARPATTVEPGEVDSNLTPEQVAAATAITRAPAPRPAARASAAQLDTTTAEQRQAAAAATPAGAEQKLGNTVASLGNPAEGGFWIKTPLVETRGIGRIVNPANGKSAKVDLIPLEGGSGSQVSLPALQLLGISLTDLPTIEVYKS